MGSGAFSFKCTGWMPVLAAQTDRSNETSFRSSLKVAPTESLRIAPKKEAAEPPLLSLHVIPGSHRQVVFPVAPFDLLRLGESRQRVGDRHLAGLVAFQAHLLKYLATAKTAVIANHVEQSITF